MTDRDNEVLHLVSNRLDRTDEKIDKLTEQFSGHEGREEGCRGRVVDLSAAVFGNGKPGLMTRMDRIEQLRQQGGTAIKVVWGVVLMLAGAVATAIAKHYWP